MGGSVLPSYQSKQQTNLRKPRARKSGSAIARATIRLYSQGFSCGRNVVRGRVPERDRHGRPRRRAKPASRMVHARTTRVPLVKACASSRGIDFAGSRRGACGGIDDIRTNR
jgi:hypothetical protein